MRYKVHLCLLAAVALLSACESKTGSQDAPQEPVVVYAAHAAESYLQDYLSGFTDETGIPVNIRFGEPLQNLNEVIANRGSPPADVLLTTSVAEIWQAADEGALRPIKGPAVAEVPDVLRDPDGFWAAFDVRYSAIGVSPKVTVPVVNSYESLASSEVHGKVCLSSSALPVNRALIAMLIEDKGPRQAEILVRGWVRNLALPPFEKEEDLIEALRSGTCHYGVLSSSVASDRVKSIGPVPLYIDIDGVGVARHARYPESADKLVNWMLQQQSLQQPASSNGRNIGLAGWRDEDAVLLAERAGYR